MHARGGACRYESCLCLEPGETHSSGEAHSLCRSPMNSTEVELVCSMVLLREYGSGSITAPYADSDDSDSDATRER